MQLTSVITLLITAQAVFCAPAAKPKSVEDVITKEQPSDTLEFELQRAPQDKPHIPQNENEVAEKAISQEISQPEVKRSERVDFDDEADLTDLSSNLKAADQDVKTVLKTFFQNLKKHPEIVEEILEREGAKLMEQPLEEEPRDTMPIDMNSIQQPSPQLNKNPKQVEKKMGGFPEYPRFIYKSPMRNMKERNMMTAQSMNNPKNSIPEDNNVLGTGSEEHTPAHDLDNAIPVIQQPSKQDIEDEKVKEILNSPHEGGDVDMAALEQAQEEYSEMHPFLNPVPIFHPPTPLKTIEPELETEIKHEVLDPKLEEEGENVLDSGVASKEENEIQTDFQEEKEKKEVHSHKESEKAQEQLETEEQNHDSESESVEPEQSQDTQTDNRDGWAEAQVDEPSPKDSELPAAAAESAGSSNKADSKFMPYDYMYYYGNEGDKMADELDPKEEGENSDEKDLEKISQEVEEEEEDEEEEQYHQKESNEGSEEKSQEIEDIEQAEEDDDEEIEEVDEEEEGEGEALLAAAKSLHNAVDKVPQREHAGYTEGGIVLPAAHPQNAHVDKDETDLLSLKQADHAHSPRRGPAHR